MWPDINTKLEKLELRNRKITIYVRSTHVTRSQPQNTKLKSQSKSVRFSSDTLKPETYKNPSHVGTIN